MFLPVTSPASVRVGAGTVKPCAVRVTNFLTYPSVDTRIVAAASVRTAMFSWDVLPSTLTYKKKYRLHSSIMLECEMAASLFNN